MASSEPVEFSVAIDFPIDLPMEEDEEDQDGEEQHAEEIDETILNFRGATVLTRAQYGQEVLGEADPPDLDFDSCQTAHSHNQNQSTSKVRDFLLMLLN